VIAGQALVGGVVQMLVARVTSSGVLDTQFSGDGIVTFVVGAGQDHANSVAVADDGSVIVAGARGVGGVQQVVVARLTSTGALDSSFGVGGLVVSRFGSTEATAEDVTLDGANIVISGSILVNGQLGFMAAKLTANGSLDPTYGVAGVTAQVLGSSDAAATAQVLRVDGSIVMAGYSFQGSNTRFTTLKLTPSGALDPAFGVGGVSIVTFPGSLTSYDFDLVEQPDGKFALVGYAQIGSQTMFALTRLTASGQVDTGFGNNGFTTTTIGTNNSEALGLTEQSTGRLVAAGYTFNATATRLALAGYIANVVVNTPPPELSLTSPANLALVDQSVLVSGSVTAFGLSSIQVKVDSAVVAILPPTTPFSYQIDLTAVSEGPHDVVVTAIDSLNQSDTKSAQIMVDHNPPTVSITQPASDTTSTAATIQVTAQATDSVTSITNVTVKVDGSSVASFASAPYFATVTMGDGSHQITAIATDQLGHVGTSATRTVVVDTTNPVIDTLTPTDNTTVGSTITANLSFHDATSGCANSTLTLRFASTQIATHTDTGCANSLSVMSLSGGDYVLTATVHDQVGHSASASHTLHVDAPHNLVLSSPADNSVVDADRDLPGSIGEIGFGVLAIGHTAHLILCRIRYGGASTHGIGKLGQSASCIVGVFRASTSRVGDGRQTPVRGVLVGGGAVELVGD